VANLRWILGIAVLGLTVAFAVRLPIPSAGLPLSVANAAPGTTEISAAVEKVTQIVNQPVPSLPRDQDALVSVYSPGWFHPGASKPDFADVDVRKTQDLSYARHEYVTSDLNPGLMFRGRDVEFNSMTKCFYRDRSLPKKRLTEEEMLEVNRLYRIIADGEEHAAAPRMPRPSSPASAPASTAPLGYASAGVLVLATSLWLYRQRSARNRVK
jgi:hypothetical protein